MIEDIRVKRITYIRKEKFLFWNTNKEWVYSVLEIKVNGKWQKIRIEDFKETE